VFILPFDTLIHSGLLLAGLACSLGLSATSQQYFFSQNKPATTDQPAVLFSQNKLAPANRTGM
jgi:hypothetical protein